MKRWILTLAGPLMIAAVPAPVSITPVASGLDHPWGVAFLPDDRVLVAERNGQLRVIAGGKLLPQPVKGVPAVYVRGQGGLFDVLPHPNFAANRLIYLSYAGGPPEANATHIARARFDGDRLSDVKVIFRTHDSKSTPAHYGARMAWLGDGTLTMTVGDGFDYREQAQKLDSGLGKIIRIRDDGSIPDDNPFVGKAGARPEIWSYGHRNQQGLAYDPVTQRLYEHEHGPRGGDEVNIIEKGGNYGWPVATHGRDYSGASISPFKTYKGMIDGVVVWVPSIAPSGLAVYRGAMFPGWNGDLLVGALVDKNVRRIDIENGRVVGEQPVFPQIKARIRDIRVAPDGAIWVTTDDAKGIVYRISR